ncbi:WD repeat-containing protein 93 [Cynoglossus semilaevis]|uniref:WD repeat domain 93 n=1 Tax=Cynoglossus semilaevis TaxID=244447 RepID=A0A3P8VWH0_CYNSE|nr:WD repeat-containing protein 93 [Cynoglossus semilaevis]XP_016887839.1 WD repeat-containing protein 93 [Cynoglossus semilaevis]XP_016887840.1 WD repeat-containing protein 93 [Cynoglossus semilaevis]
MADRYKIGVKVLELSATKELPDSTNSIACSEDGKYLSLGHPRGLSVWCVCGLVWAAEWLKDRQEIIAVQMVSMSPEAYLIGTIDYMGVARIFAYYSENIYLLNVINSADDVNRRKVCLTFELSPSGNYAATIIGCNADVWLEVYRLPTEAWTNQLENLSPGATPFRDPEIRNQESGEDEGGQKWSPTSAPTRIKPPKKRSRTRGSTTESSRDVGVVNFLTFCLSVDEDAGAQNLKMDMEPINPACEVTRRGTHHFLLPCGHFPGASKAYAQPECPVAVCLWWTGSRNLLHYYLQKSTKNKPDDEPDILWPNANEILCSTVSRCTRYVVLGLVNSLVCVWDRKTGSPLSVVSMTTVDSPFLRMRFMDYIPQCPAPTDEVHILVLCTSGLMHMVTTGRGAEPSISQAIESPEDAEDFPTLVQPVPFLQSTLLVVQKNGTVLLQDVMKKTTLCYFDPPRPRVIATPWNPVYALNMKEPCLYIRGDQTFRSRVTSEEEVIGHLLVYNFKESELFKPYLITPPNSLPENPFSFATLQEQCNLYLQQRALGVEQRNKDIRQTWEELLRRAAEGAL